MQVRRDLSSILDLNLKYRIDLRVDQMDVQTCNPCHVSKSITEFSWRYRKLGIRQPTCKVCQGQQHARWYRKNKERHKANMYANKQANVVEAQAFIANHFAANPCIDCGETDLRVLEFDHVRGRKRNGVMKMVRDGYKLESIRAEIAKCVVRCANCHKKRTFKDSWRGR